MNYFVAHFLSISGGYNPINGEAYAANSKNNENEKQPEPTVKAPEESNGNGQTTNPTETENVPAENGNTQAVPTETTAAVSAQAPPVDNKNGQKVDNAQKV